MRYGILVILVLRLSLFSASSVMADPATKELSLHAFRVSLKTPCTLVHVWAAWCEPCVEELPGLLKFIDKHQEIHPLVIDVTLPEQRRTLSAKLLSSAKISFPTYYRPKMNDDAFVHAIDKTWAGALPYTALYQGGKKRQTWIGPVGIDALIAAIHQECGK